MPDPTPDEYLAALHATQAERNAAAEELCHAAVHLAVARRGLDDAERHYRMVREAAESTGWTAADLDRAGLPRVATWIDPAAPLTEPYDDGLGRGAHLSAYLPR